MEEELERMSQRPSRRGRAFRAPVFGYVCKQIVHCPQDRLDSPLAKHDESAFSLNKKRRWEMEKELAGRGRMLDEMEEGLEVFTATHELAPAQSIIQRDFRHLRTRKLNLRRRKEDADSDDSEDEEVVHRSATGNLAALGSLAKQPRASARSRREADRRRRRRNSTDLDESEDSDADEYSWVEDPPKNKDLIKFGFHFIHGPKSQSYIAAKFRKRGRCERVDMVDVCLLKRREKRSLLSACEGWTKKGDDTFLPFSDIPSDDDAPSQCSASPTLGDFILPPKNDVKKPKKRKLMPTSVPIEDWFYPSEEELHSASASASADIGRSAESDSAPLPAAVAFPSQRFVLERAQLDSAILEDTYGESYWECSLWPRRFVVDISRSVVNTQRVAHGAAADARAVRVSVSFAVEPPSRRALKLLSRLHSEDGWAFVNVWVNGNFNESAKRVSMEISFNDEFDVTPNEILKAVAVHVGTLPYTIFNVGETTVVPRPVLSPGKAVSGGVGIASSITYPASASQHLLLSALRKDSYSSAVDSGVDSGSSEGGDDSWLWVGEKADSECRVCLAETSDGAALGACDHFFCAECWASHVGARLTAASPHVSCMEPGCSSSADARTLLSLVPASLVGRLESLQADSFLLSHRHRFAFCPNDFCSLLHKFTSGRELSVASCGCGRRWCRECGEAGHWPAECGVASAYEEQLVLNGDDRLLVVGEERKVKVKRCPHCFTRMEKGTGCNHMSCRCGQSFCWACGGKWDIGRHYNCTMSSGNFETVVLVDVSKSVKNATPGMLKAANYARAAAHRQASFVNHSRRKRRRQWRATSRVEALLGGEPLSAYLSRLLSVCDAGHALLEWWEVWASSTKPSPQLRVLAAGLDFLLRRLTESLDGRLLNVGGWTYLEDLSGRIAHAQAHFTACITGQRKRALLALK